MSELAVRYRHIQEALTRKASRLFEGSYGGSYHDATEIPGRHPDFPANPQPVTSWDDPLDSNRAWEKIIRKSDLKQEKKP